MKIDWESAAVAVLLSLVAVLGLVLGFLAGAGMLHSYSNFPREWELESIESAIQENGGHSGELVLYDEGGEIIKRWTVNMHGESQ